MKRQRKAVCLGGMSLALLALGTATLAEEVIEESLGTEYQTLRLVRVAGGFEHPWSVALLPGDRFLVTERPGRLLLIEDGEAQEVEGVPEVHTHLQGGLLDVVPHPGFDENRWLYFTYSRGDDEATASALGRARLVDEQLVDQEALFEQNRRFEPGRHYGSRLAWLPDGSLLMSIGDRGEPDSAQDTGDHAGSVLRLGADGLAPEDNPHVGHAEILPEIYSWGHRNVQGLVVDTQSGAAWATEHGPRGGDELNRIEAGRNYGWPRVSRGRDYGTEGPLRDAVRSALSLDEEMVDPIHEFLPTFAPSGLALVTGDRYPNWQGNLVAGGLSAERAYRIVIEEDEVVHMEELLLGKVGRIRDVRQGPDGYLYVLSDDEEDGGLYRLEPVDD
ncbi:PQQ-dependent sugar dehydrogenase [Halomonas heilongjiangensis]|uniref:Glucose/Sorbosone dehydrogenase domain-containing protein n=1 Tax=Halomonas heilongjiangensis TaxID=1387883 RepID=A0A2N7TGR9_9GAMM|nr:PQQ-dependent sugar dehydrogenase [Halomonas heilongjiangensis]PMR67380.1 hypothetical protein C1H66_19700 [Halomonas heilongjiangensis]PXX91138.1 hypothetical protein CR158_08210 [Halomonas heilongjiangensis]